MKPIALLTLASLFTAAPFAAAEEKTSANSSSSVSVTSNSSDGKGKAVIEIEINGKKERREIDLPAGGGSVVVTTRADSGSGPVTFLGLSSGEIDDAVAAQLPIDKGTGLLVESVQAGSPAAQAGLQKNDVLTRFDDQILTNPEQLQALVRSKKPGDEVKLNYFHKGQQINVTVKLASNEWKPTDIKAPVVKIGGKNLDVNELLESMKKGGSPLTIEKKVVVVGPDGNVIMSDAAKTFESVVAELQETLKSKVGPEIMESVRKALEDAQKAVEDGAQKAEDAAKK
jgi:membrane-associated protease RseP (regulator of RpoE activity)